MFRQLFQKSPEEEMRKSEEIKKERDELKEIIDEQEDFETEKPEEINLQNIEEKVEEDDETDGDYSDDSSSDSDGFDELDESEEEEGEEDTKEEKDNSDEKIKVKIGDVEEEFTKEEVEKILENVFLNEDSINISDEAKVKLSIVDKLQAEQLKMVADALSGNIEAQKALLKQLNIDPYELDLDEEVNYNPNLDELKTDSVQSFIETLSKREPKVASEIVETFNSLPEDAQKELYDVRALKVMEEYAKQGTLKNIIIKAKAKKRVNQYMSWVEALAIAEQEVIKRRTKTNKETKKIRGKKSKSSKSNKNPYLLSTDELRKEVYGLLKD